MSDLLHPPTADGAAAPALVLRVFGGRLHGAEQRLPAGGGVRIGHGFDNDLVLRGRRTAGTALSVRLEDGQARVRLLSGAASLLGCPLTPDAPALLPLYLPLTVGEYALAIGEADSPRWADVPRLVATTPAMPAGAAATESPEAAGGEDDAPLATPPARAARMKGWLLAEGGALGRRLPFAGPGGLLAASAALLMIAGAEPAYRAVSHAINSPEAVAGGLRAAGYAGLRVRRDPLNGGLVVEGRVADEAAVEKLRRLVNDRYDRVALNVSTTAAAAAAVTELLRGQGIDAEAAPGRTGIVVRSEYLPRDRLAQLHARIARDLPGAGPLRFVLDESRGPRDLQYFFASEKFGLASYVDGDPGHIVTADGQYWFAGAMLPTGHRLLAVADGQIRFERDGLVESLRVSAPGASPSPAVAAPPPAASAPPPAAPPAEAEDLPATEPSTEPPTTIAGLVAPARRS